MSVTLESVVEQSELEPIPPGFLSWVAGLVHEHRSGLVGYARRLGVDSEEALDCVQDAFQSFLQLPQARSVVGESEDSAKLLMVILRHIVWNRRSRNSRRERILAVASAETDELTTGSDELIADAERVAILRGCIQHMARLQRAVIELSLLDDLSGEDIAQAVGVSHGHVRVLLHRARAKLRTCTSDT